MTKESSLNKLHCENVSCIRGDNTLFEGLSLHADSGELLRIRGENGSGKTSLLKLISGITSPDSGEILWNDTPIKQSEIFTQDIAYLAHRDGIKSELTALENLNFYREFYKHASDETTDVSLDNILEQLDLLHTLYIEAGKLSFGQRRRLAFARLLLSNTQLWLLDEPFTGIDVNGRQLLENLCLNFINDGGIIVMTHHAELENKQLRRKERSIELTQFNPLFSSLSKSPSSSQLNVKTDS